MFILVLEALMILPVFLVLIVGNFTRINNACKLNES